MHRRKTKPWDIKNNLTDASLLNHSYLQDLKTSFLTENRKTFKKFKARYIQIYFVLILLSFVNLSNLKKIGASQQDTEKL